MLTTPAPPRPAVVSPALRVWATGIDDGVILGARATINDHATGALSVEAPPEALIAETTPVGLIDGATIRWPDLPVGESVAVTLRMSAAAGASAVAQVRLSRPGHPDEVTALALAGLPTEQQTRKTVLPNGLTVMTKERLDSETVAVVVAVRAGSVDEDDLTSGGSHWLEHAHFLGTARRPNNQAVFGDVAAVGGDINATTGWELTDYFIAVPVDHFDTALDVLADMLLDSEFPVEAFNRERKVVFEELNRRANTPGTLASDLFYSNVFRVHPARRLIGGTIDSVRNIPLDTILDYRAQRYVTGNMTIGVAGAIDHETAVNRVERAFHRLPSGSWIDRPTVHEPPADAPRSLSVSLGDKQVVVMLGNLAPSITHPDREAFYVLDSILDTTGRRLATEIRDKRGLATSVGSSYYGLTDVGAWSVSAITRPEHLDEVLALVRRELQRLCDEEPSDAEVADAARSVRGSQRLSEERNLSQARSLAREHALGVLEPTAEWLARLDAVTPADVRRVAQQYLTLDTATLVTVSF